MGEKQISQEPGAICWSCLANRIWGNVGSRIKAGGGVAGSPARCGDGAAAANIGSDGLAKNEIWGPRKLDLGAIEKKQNLKKNKLSDRKAFLGKKPSRHLKS